MYIHRETHTQRELLLWIDCSQREQEWSHLHSPLLSYKECYHYEVPAIMCEAVK